jgi:hypothetical protein
MTRRSLWETSQVKGLWGWRSRSAKQALRQFPAEEVIVVTRPGDAAGRLERDSAEEASERFGVPVTHLVVERG